MGNTHRVNRRSWLVGVAAVAVVAAGCAPSQPPVGSVAPQATARPLATMPQVPPPSAPAPAQPRLAADPARIADDLVADERTVRDPSSPEPVLLAAARRQQVAYRTLARRPDWDSVARSRMPGELVGAYDHNIDARRQLAAMHSGGKPTVPPWRIVAPAPAGELLGYYREAEAAFGVSWNHLAAINLVETAFGRIAGTSTAGAMGPMQFLPSTFAAYGDGGDILSPRDSILAAGRMLAANGFSRDPDAALYRYNNSNKYVRAINSYATVMAADPGAFAGFYRWDVYYFTVAGDVVLPVGYAATAPIPAEEYLAANPQ